ncbi:hypothetical protein SAMN04487915_101404 [Arthrobacter sp. ov118]|nr:hypothetical protein SAMN04487915_101404 [Arthrobacter sp. ov118]
MFKLQPTASYNDVVIPSSVSPIQMEPVGLLRPVRPLAGYGPQRRKSEENPKRFGRPVPGTQQNATTPPLAYAGSVRPKLHGATS